MTTPKKILVAGGAGFIGSHLCEALLLRGDSVTCVDSLLTGSEQNLERFGNDPAFRFVRHDVIDELPPGLEADMVINLACAASPPHYGRDPVHTMLTSVVGTYNLLEFSAARNARFLQASTSEIYGDPLAHPQRESYFGNVNPNGPRACYDEGKRSAETLCGDYRRLKGTDARIVRIFNTYGPRMRADDGRVVSNVICQALSGSEITIYGEGSQTRSFCYVTDLVAGLLKLLDHEGPSPGPVNIGNPCEITVAELVDQILDLTGSKSRRVRMPLPADDPKQRCPDISLARVRLGWQPRVDLREGLLRTIAWFENGMEPHLTPVPSRKQEQALARGFPRPTLAGASSRVARASD